MLQKGFRAVVFDGDAGLEAHRRDWTMLIHWAMPMLEELLAAEVLAELPRALCNPYLCFDGEDRSKVESLPCYNGTTGRLLFRSATPGARRVSRQALRRLLARRVQVQWRKRLVALSRRGEDEHLGGAQGTANRGGGQAAGEGRVRLEFDDGERFEADYVLGTDGSSSTVRELLLGGQRARLSKSGLLFATGITKFGDAAKTEAIVNAHPVAALMMGTSSVGAVGGRFLAPFCSLSWAVAHLQSG